MAGTSSLGKRTCNGGGDDTRPAKRLCVDMPPPDNPPTHETNGDDDIIAFLAAAETISGWTKQKRTLKLLRCMEVRQLFRRTLVWSLLKWSLATQRPMHVSVSAIQVRATSNFNSRLPGMLVLYDEQTDSPFFCPAMDIQDLIFQKLPSMLRVSGRGKIQHYYSKHVRVFLSFTLVGELAWGRPIATVTNIQWLENP